jgi:4-nitrophenyl phosphatase
MNKVFFLTNSALKSRSQLLARFQALGIEATKEECYTSAYAAALYLKSQGFADNGKKVFVVGMGAIEEELVEAGIDFCGGTKEAAIAPSEDDSIGAVVVGLDLNLTYNKIAEASMLLRYNPDVLFIATNADACRNGSDGRLHPGAGVVVRAIEVGSGRSPQIVGKPNTLLLSALAATQGVEPSQSIMVGDRLDTDIAFGQQGHMAATMLMMTGVTCLDTLASSEIQPTFVCESFVDLVKH